jgi:hypothetical protein
LVGPRLLSREISRGCREFNCFFNCNVCKHFYIETVKWKKSFTKKKTCLKTHFSELFYEKQQF